ncbi:MAG: hypothetical protein AABX89_07290 [Candidatus Thermoplasmatota archaeon]
MTWASRLPILLAASLMVAGCLNSGPTRPDFEQVEQDLTTVALPLLELDHGDDAGHRSAALHAGRFNLELVGYSNGLNRDGPNALPPLGQYTEIAVGTNGYVYLSGFSPDGSFGGLSIIDVQNASAPKAVGRYDGLPAVDVEVDPDGRFAYLATQRTAEHSVRVLQDTQDPFAALPRGIVVLDVEDKTAPTFVNFLPLPVNGPHTLTHVRHPNGNDYLLVCTYDLLTDPVTGALAGVVPVTQRLIVYLIAELPAPAPALQLLPVAQFQLLQSSSSGGPLVFPHDARVSTDLSDPSRVLLTLAYWDEGVRILDFTNPPEPTIPPTNQAQSPMLKEIGSFKNFAPSRYNNIHLAMPFEERIAGRSITVAQPEIPGAPEETGQVSILDSTNPASPTLLGSWTLNSINPELAITGFDFSPHNFDLWDGKIALGHFHAGVWVLDVSDEANLREPKPVAFYMPAIPRANSPVAQPNVWGVVEQGGLLYVVDEATGLHILRYTGP